MPHLSRSFIIKPRDFTHAGEVSIKVRSILKSIGFDVALIRRVSLCAYEAEMNVVMHGGHGNLLLSLDPENIILDVSDDGPGIEDLDLAFQEGYSTATLEHREMGFGAGMGLPNIKKSSDTLKVHTAQDKGLHLKMGFRSRVTSVDIDPQSRWSIPSMPKRWFWNPEAEDCAFCPWIFWP